MPTELTMLSEVVPTPLAMIAAIAELHPDGSFIEYRGGDMVQFVAADGTPLLTVYRTRAVHVAYEAARALADPPPAFALWTDMTIPFGDPTDGRAAAEAIAAAVGGVIKDRF